MKRKLLSGFLCVLLIATFQVENSEALSPGRVKRSVEVREKIPIKHTAQSRVMVISFVNPCLRALKNKIVESNSKKKILF